MDAIVLGAFEGAIAQCLCVQPDRSMLEKAAAHSWNNEDPATSDRSDATARDTSMTTTMSKSTALLVNEQNPSTSQELMRPSPKNPRTTGPHDQADQTLGKRARNDGRTGRCGRPAPHEVA